MTNEPWFPIAVFAILANALYLGGRYIAIRVYYRRRKRRMVQRFLHWLDTPPHERGRLTRQDIQDAADGH
jgi:hypothetical protein